MVKLIVVVAFIAIVIALASGMFHLLSNKNGDPDKHKADSDKLFKSLAWRIGLSVALFSFLMISYFAGWIKPQGTMIQLKQQAMESSTTK